MKCPNCKKEVPNEAKFCLYCGTQIEVDVSTIECPSCHNPIPADSKFCPDCGSKIDSNRQEEWMFFFPYQQGKDKNGNLLYGYKDIRTEAVIIPPKYNYAFRFYEGFAAVGKITQDNKSHMGFINAKGIETVPLIHSSAFRFSEGKAWVEDSNEEWRCINTKGENLFSFPFDYLKPSDWKIYGMPEHYINGISKASLEYIGEPNPYMRSDVHVESYINDAGETVSQEGINKYQWLQSETECPNAKVFEDTNGLYGVIDNLGNTIVAPIYDDITHEGGGIFVVKKDEQYGAFFENGKELAPCLFSDFPLVHGELECALEFWEKDETYKFNYWGRIN